MSRLLCFAAQHAVVAAMLAPFVSGELVEVKPASDIAWGEALRDAAKPGDVLVIAAAHEKRVTGDVFEVARQVGLSTWHLSDHWAKAKDQPAAADAAQGASDEPAVS